MNIEFKRPELEDRDIIMRYFAKQKSRACECTFSCVYLWSRFYPVEYAIIEDMMVCKCGKEDIFFDFPFFVKSKTFFKTLLLLYFPLSP